MSSFRRLWKKWASRGDRQSPTTLAVLAWLCAGILCFVLGGFVPDGLLVWTLVWLLIAVVSILDLASLRRLGVPSLTRTLGDNWQIGVAHEVTIHVEYKGMGSLTSNRRWNRTQLDVGEPDDVLRTVSPPRCFASLAGHQAEFKALYQPARRGKIRFSPVDFAWESPLRLWRRMNRYEDPDQASHEVLVLPDLTSWRNEVLSIQRALHDDGQHVRRAAVGSAEFSYIADYAVFDNPRHINWAATARRGKLMKNVYEPERGQHVVIAIDASRYMGVRLPDGKLRLDYAVDCAAALAQTALALGDQVGILAFTDEILLKLPPGNGTKHYAEVVRQLAAVEPKPVQGGYDAVFRSLSGRFRRRSLLFVLSELEGVATDVGLLPALATFSQRHPTLFVTVADVQARAAVKTPPKSPRDAALVAAAEWVLQNREREREQLLRNGVQVIESMPGTVVVEAVREYARRKRRQGW